MFDPAGTGSLNEAERLEGWNAGDNGSRSYQSAAHFDVLRILKTCKFRQEREHDPRARSFPWSESRTRSFSG